MKGTILALGVAVATLGIAGTASADPPRGYHQNWHRGHHGYHRGYWPGYRSGYYAPYRGYYPGYGHRSYGYPGYAYPGYGYSPGFSFGVQGPRGGSLLFNFR